MLFSAITMSAKQYCGESMTSGIGWGGQYELSAEKINDTQSRITIAIAEGEQITGFYQLIIQNQGGGTASKSLFDPGDADFNNPDLFSVSADGKSAVININWTTYPTGNIAVHLVLRRNNSTGGSDIFGNNIADLDVSATCGASGEGGEGGEDGGETGVPVLESVELFGAAQNFVLLTPTATDDKGVTSYLIAQSGGAESEVTPDATTGQIKVASLTLGKEYTYIVKAKDADGNVSNAKEITFSTLDNVFCEEEVLPNPNLFFANQKLTYTAKKVSDTETYFAITSSTSTLTGINTVTLTRTGGGALPDDYVLKDGWTLKDNTLSKTVTWKTYPTSPITIAISAKRTFSTGESSLIGVPYSVDVSNTCGEEPESEETIIADTYFAPSWQEETNSTATYDAETGAITVDLKSQFNGQWQAQVKVKHDIEFEALKKYQCSVKFHANKAVNGVTLKIDDNTAMIYEDQTISIPANEDYVYTSAVVNGVPGNNKIMVFDFGWAEPCQITISDISIQEVKEQVEEGFEWDGTAVASPSNKGFGTFQGRLDLYNIVDGYAGTDACGQVDLYVVTWGNDMLYKAKLVNNQFIDNGTGWRCQLRTKNAELSDGVRETWAIAATEDGTTRYTLYGNLNNTQGLNGYGETFKVYSYMTVKNCAPDERTIKTLTYTRDHINNPIADNIAPTLSGAANVTSTAENVTIALPAVTSEEVFYMIKDEAHNKQYISITPSFVLPQDESGITYTYSCYAVDFNGNMSAPLTAEVSMAFNATSNLALNKPCQAGFEANNMGASKANDGKTDSRWASGGGNNPTDAWWYVDLGESYNLSTIEISWEGAFASDYVIMGSDDYIDPTNATAWQAANTLVSRTIAPVVGADKQEVYSVTGQHARYIRLQANTLANNAWGCSFWEFRVFGTGVYDPSAAADTEKPVITSATPKEPIAHNEVQITMVASDNVGVVSYEVKDDAKGVSVTCVPVDNVITVSNLQEQTTYNLSIVAVDAVGNKSDAYAMTAFTTSINPYIPHEAAPVPTRDAEDVIAFYSDNYAPVVNLWGKSQWNAVTLEPLQNASDNYLYYTGGNWWGWEFGVNAGANVEGISSGVDCSAMEYLHIDVWGFENGTIRILPIWGGTNLVENKALDTNDRYYALVEIRANQWNSVDIPLATGFQPEADKHDFSSIFQFKFADRTTTAVAIDNVYFWKSAGTSPVESVTLDKTVATIEVEEALQLKATVLPMEAANKNVVWTSSDATVANVVDGLITGLKEGTTTITATTEDGNKTATCAITVEPITVKTWWGGPVALTLAGQEHYVLYSFTRNENKTITYTAIFDQGNIDVVKEVSFSGVYNALEWMDADKTTASWTSTTTHNAGEKILGFFFFGGPRIDFDKEAIAYIVGSSNERPILSVESVTLDKTSCELMPNETAQLVATVNPGYVDNKNVDWTSSNTAVATVDANGLVTAVAAGSAIITATSVADNTKTATCTVNVMAELTDITYHASTSVKKDAAAYLGINYSITRTSDRTLRYVIKVNNSEYVDLEFNVVVNGNWQRMTYDASTNTYTYTTITTYADGDVVSGFFRQIKYGVEGRWDFNYVVGSTSTTPRTMVAFNDEDVDLSHLNNGSVYDVILKRNFVMDGDWNTICLPFALTADQVKEVFGEGTQLTKLSSSALISSTEVEILFESVTSMEAATPYLIKPEKNVNEGVFLENVTINTTPIILEAGITKMIPVLKTQAFTGENNTFFLGANEVLYKASTSGNIMAMRAYFQFSTLTPEQLRNVRARVVFNENTETSVDNITIDEAPIKVIQNGQLIIIRNGVKYNVQGQKL